jgi:hypothetical protein
MARPKKTEESTTTTVLSEQATLQTTVVPQATTQSVDTQQAPVVANFVQVTEGSIDAASIPYTLSSSANTAAIIVPAPRRQLRDADGLLIGKQYKYDEFGLIDYKAMIPSKFLRVRKDKEDEVKKKFKVADLDDLDKSTVPDYFLYMTLGGINYLANLRGYVELDQRIEHATDTKTVAVCNMTFIPNFENPDGLSCAGVASASIYNVSNGFESYIETFAENRAFARCVRRALRISVVTEDEIGGEDKVELRKAFMDKQKKVLTESPESVPSSSSAAYEPWQVLEERCRNYTPPRPFESIKQTAINAYETGRLKLKNNPVEWTDFKDIKQIDAFIILNEMEKLDKAKALAAAKAT